MLLAPALSGSSNKGLISALKGTPALWPQRYKLLKIYGCLKDNFIFNVAKDKNHSIELCIFAIEKCENVPKIEFLNVSEKKVFHT